MDGAQDERRRLDALKALDILDSDPEPGFEAITRLAADLFQVPISAVSLVDAERQWFKSSVGLEVCETSRDLSLCAHAVSYDDMLVLPDTLADPRFCDHPAVTGDPYLRFYAGAPVRFAGQNVGTLCIADYKPRAAFSVEDRTRLMNLADAISSMMEMRKDGLIKKEIIRAKNETQKKLEMMEAVAGVGYWHVDVPSQAVQWSRGIFAIYGLTPETYQPRLGGGSEYFHPDDWPMIQRHIEAATKEGTPFGFEARLRRADGEERAVLSQGVVELDEKGAPLSLFGVFQDITEQKKIEHTLRQATQNAEAFALAQSDFLSNMSHEIRTPLTTIIGYSDLLSEMDELPQAAKNCVLRLQRRSKTLLSLVNDVLDYSRLEAGQVELDPQPTDVRMLIEEACDHFAGEAAAKGLKLHVDTADFVSDWVELDGTRLTQVVNNLVGNACKFTTEGEVRVRLLSLGDNLMRLEVHDTGPGVTPEQQTRLFKRFSQADNSIHRAHGGSGLGLSICQEIANLMGGAIGCQSEPGKGSCFWFEAPAPVTNPDISSINGEQKQCA